MRLAPFFLLAAVVACGSPALPSAGSLNAAARTSPAEIQEISLEISALM